MRRSLLAVGVSNPLPAAMKLAGAVKNGSGVVEVLVALAARALNEEELTRRVASRIAA